MLSLFLNKVRMSGLGFQTSLILGTVCSFMLRLVSLLNERIPNSLLSKFIVDTCTSGCLTKSKPSPPRGVKR